LGEGGFGEVSLIFEKVKYIAKMSSNLKEIWSSHIGVYWGYVILWCNPWSLVCRYQYFGDTHVTSYTKSHPRKLLSQYIILKQFSIYLIFKWINRISWSNLLSWRGVWYIPPKLLYIFTRFHGVIDKTISLLWEPQISPYQNTLPNLYKHHYIKHPYSYIICESVISPLLHQLVEHQMNHHFGVSIFFALPYSANL
jgi:hypothetical protein